MRSEELDVVLSRRASRGRRALRWVVVALALLGALGLALGSVAAGREPGAPAVAHATATPHTQARPPAVEVLSNESFGVVTLNGSAQGMRAPVDVSLRAGLNVLTLSAPPFRAKACTIRWPIDPLALGAAVVRGDCVISAVGQGDQVRTFRILMPVTISDLPPNEQAGTLAALTRALATYPIVRTTVPAGVYYGAGLDAQGVPLARQATEPLTATLSLAPDTADDDPTGTLAECHPACAGFAQEYMNAPTNTWALMMTPVLRWRFTTATGRVVGEETLPASDLVLPLLLTYDTRLGWWPDATSMQPLPDPWSGKDLNGCEAGVTILSDLSLARLTVVGRTVQYGAKLQPEGCELLIVGADQTVLGRFVWRFGALLAANAQAHALFRELPMASPDEVAAVEA